MDTYIDATARPHQLDSGLIVLSDEAKALAEARADIDELEREIAEYQEEHKYDRKDGRRFDVKQGICRGTKPNGYACARRTTIWMPAALCEKCLQRAALEIGVDLNE